MSRTKNAELPERRRARVEQLSRAYLIWRTRRESGDREDSGYFERDARPSSGQIAAPASGSAYFPAEYGRGARLANA